MKTDRVHSDGEVAERLAAMLRDDEWWALAEESAVDESTRPVMARRAVELYDFTGTVVKQRAHEPIGVVGHAIAITRDIADSAAIRSCDWGSAEQLRFAPSRGVIELEVALYEVDQWAAGLGIEITAKRSPVPDDAWNDGVDEPGIDRDLATHFTEMITAYDQILDLARTNEGRQALRNRFREMSCKGIIGSRDWLTWTRRNVPKAELAAGVLLYTSQASYVITHTANETGLIFPAREDIRDMLEGTEALAWLEENGASLPAWIN